jgi:hypothetical protein
MSFAHLLRNNSEKGKYSPDGADAHDENDTESMQRIKGDADLKAGKHEASHRMIQAMKEGDHEALSGALEDWHELHGPNGAEAAKDPEDTRSNEDEDRYKLGKSSGGSRD